MMLAITFRFVVDCSMVGLLIEVRSTQEQPVSTETYTPGWAYLYLGSSYQSPRPIALVDGTAVVEGELKVIDV